MDFRSKHFSEEGVSPSPQTTVATALDRAAQLNRAGKLGRRGRVGSALAAARATPYEIEFQTRVRLGMALSATYVSLEQLEDARALLADEVAFRREDFANHAGDRNNPNAKTRRLCHIYSFRDRASGQLALIGEVAASRSRSRPGFNGGPLTLEELRGRVVLLDSGHLVPACQEMFTGKPGSCSLTAALIKFNSSCVDSSRRARKQEVTRTAMTSRRAGPLLIELFQFGNIS